MDHIFEQKLVRENHQLQFELAKLNKQIKQLQEKVVGYEQMLSQLDEGEMRNRRLADSLNKQGGRIRTGNTRLAAMDAHIKDVAKTQGGDAAQAADSALWQQRGQTSRGIDQAQVKAGKLETALNTGMAAVERSRARRVARGSFSDKPKEQAQADRIKNIGTGIQTQQTQLSVQSTPKSYTAPNGGQNITMGTTARLGSISSDSLAAQGKLPTKKFGATGNQQRETLSSMRADSAAERKDRAAIQSYAAKARNKANKPV
jgi:myosin heavy subunit